MKSGFAKLKGGGWVKKLSFGRWLLLTGETERLGDSRLIYLMAKDEKSERWHWHRRHQKEQIRSVTDGGQTESLLAVERY
jgi:hypothetical protein